ncbi:MAG TPA: hypothetical protein VFQ45_02355 [Longimicrobium sp.]|nr:hypothetical protein [Longimicrobium sp.]
MDQPLAPDRLRDPWVRPGIALLVGLSLFVLFLYLGQPQSPAEVRGRAWVALSPDAFTPRISRARERVASALAAAAAGDTAAAIARYAEAEEEALTAQQRAGTPRQAATAAELWAGIALDRAGMMLAAGATPWYRGDNEQLLAEALATVQRVAAAPVSPAARQRAAALTERIQRQLRPAPLEWLPR